MDVQGAIDEAGQRIDAMAGPSQMSQAEAVEFYQGVASHCNDWAQTITEEMNE